MIKEGMTVREAAEQWVGTFNAFPTDMIDKLMTYAREYGDGNWDDVTVPTKGDRCYDCRHEEACEVIGWNEETEMYKVLLDSGSEVEVEGGWLDQEGGSSLPMWGTMWAFGDPCDDWWLEQEGNLAKMCECGFKVYYNDDWGYFFGIDGAGYDFYESHWIPLYKARGLQWHDERTETEE